MKSSFRHGRLPAQVLRVPVPAESRRRRHVGRGHRGAGGGGGDAHRRVHGKEIKVSIKTIEVEDKMRIIKSFFYVRTGLQYLLSSKLNRISITDLFSNPIFLIRSKFGLTLS